MPSSAIEKRRSRTLFLTQFSLLLAIEAIVCFTPLGSLPIGPLVATLSHIPVIVTAITLGLGAGALMGFFFGLFSFIVWTFSTPNPLLAFLFTPVYAPGNFWSIVICFLPRILIGAVTALVFGALQKLLEKHGKEKLDFLSYTVSALCGALTNTALVCGIGYFAFVKELGEAFGGDIVKNVFTFIIAFAGVNGLLEIALAIVCAYVICKPIRTYVLPRMLK